MLFVVRIIIHLDDEEPPVLVERDRDRVGHQRLGCNQLEAKSLSQLKSIQCIPRRHRWESGQFLRIGNPLLSGAQG